MLTINNQKRQRNFQKKRFFFYLDFLLFRVKFCSDDDDHHHHYDGNPRLTIIIMMMMIWMKSFLEAKAKEKEIFPEIFFFKKKIEKLKFNFFHLLFLSYFPFWHLIYINFHHHHHHHHQKTNLIEFWFSKRDSLFSIVYSVEFAAESVKIASKIQNIGWR